MVSKENSGSNCKGFIIKYLKTLALGKLIPPHGGKDELCFVHMFLAQ